MRVGILLLSCLLLSAATLQSAEAKTRYRMRVKVVGLCDAYFNNYKRGPYQVVTTPEGSQCTAKVKVWKVTRRKGRRGRTRTPLAGEEITLLRTDSYFGEWFPVSIGQTNNVGIVQLPFEFSSDACGYLSRAENGKLSSTPINLFAENDVCARVV